MTLVLVVAPKRAVLQVGLFVLNLRGAKKNDPAGRIRAEPTMSVPEFKSAPSC